MAEDPKPPPAPTRGPNASVNPPRPAPSSGGASVKPPSPNRPSSRPKAPTISRPPGKPSGRPPPPLPVTASKRPEAPPRESPPGPPPAPRSAPAVSAPPSRPSVEPSLEETSVVAELLSVDEWDIEEQRTDLLRAALAAPGAPPKDGARGSAPPPAQVPDLQMPTAEEMAGPVAEAAAARSTAKKATRSPLLRRSAKEDPNAPRGRREELVDLLHARGTTLETPTGQAGEASLERARVHLELALVDELLGTGAEVVPQAEEALALDAGMTAAHAALRRARHARPAHAALLTHLDVEIAATSVDAVRADLLGERARLVEASGGELGAIRAAWDRALATTPEHPAALKGLEAAWSAEGSGEAAARQLAEHLARMADAYLEGGEGARLAAWIHVERAQLLDARLHDDEAARAALERALALDPGIGPVRTACVRHAAAHGDAARLVELLAAEAEIEPSTSRAARLELDAACIARARLADVDTARRLLERALGRAPTNASVDRYVLDELVSIYEAAGAWSEAARARRARLTYVTEPRAEAYELRSLAALAERAGDLHAATVDVERALSLDPGDATLVEEMDRLLAATGRADARAALYSQLAARTEDPSKRARILLRAARIAEESGKRDEALTTLRAAWIAAPHDAEVLDRLTALLGSPPSPSVDADARARVTLYEHAADHETDPARRVAYLEKVAHLWEETLAEPALAARAYEAILAIEPGRRGAVVGLARAAARAGDAPALVRALLDEATSAPEGKRRAALVTRAANAIAATDPERARTLTDEALRADPACDEARQLAMRLHADANRWGEAAQVLEERIAHADAKAAPEHVVLLRLTQAEILTTRLHDPNRAIAALEAARALDAAHPVPPIAILRALEELGDLAKLASAYERLADAATDPAEQARWLTQAAAIDELRLGDDAAAAKRLTRALAAAPHDELVVDRLVRVLLRTAPLLEAERLLSARMQGGGPAPAKRGRAFERAMLLLDAGDGPAAGKLVEALLEEEPGHVPALRMQERIARAAGAIPVLANALSQQADALPSRRARLGALWGLAFLIEWKLPASPGTDIYDRILRLAPGDRSALDGSLRRSVREARHGDHLARGRATAALRALLEQAGSDTSRLALHLAIGLLLEGAEDEASRREALASYGAALGIDPRSVTAATGAARLASVLKHTEIGVASAVALSDIAREPKARARYLLEAAELLLAAPDAALLGPIEARRERAARLLEQALDADPESIAVAARLATVRTDEKRTDLLVAAFRAALARAKAPEAILLLAAEICRIARTDLHDVTLAVEAMRRAREAAPKHVPTLLTLAELYLAQRAFAEAVEVLEAVLACATDAGAKLTALFALASLYENVMNRGGEVERVFRDALRIDPQNARALRGVVRAVRQSAPFRAGDGAARGELASLLTRLAEAEPTAEQKQAIHLELVDLQTALGDRAAAERALIEAAAFAPTPAALARLSSFYKRDGAPAAEIDVAAYGRALSSVVSRAEALGRADASWLSTLGQLEVEKLGRAAEGIAHLRKALQLSPDLHEARVVLAAGLLKGGLPAEASDHVLRLLVPDARPLLGLRAPLAALELLEQAFAGDRRMQEALVTREVRALAGGLDDTARAWLRARRLPHDAAHDTLERGTLFAAVVPPEGRGLPLQIAHAGYGTEAKALRTNPGELGLSARDRVGHRSGHPLRAPFERVLRALHLDGVELIVTDAVSSVRVMVQDTPWVIAPSYLSERAEPIQTAALARGLTRVALGVPWLEDMPPPHAAAYLVALGRQGSPSYAGDLREPAILDLVGEYEARVAHGIGRRQRKQLAELAAHLDGARAPTLAEIDAVQLAVTRAELRVAFLLTGDLMASLDEVRAIDPALGRAGFDLAGLAATWAHPLAGDLVRYALAREATALRFRLGSAWG